MTPRRRKARVNWVWPHPGSREDLPAALPFPAPAALAAGGLTGPSRVDTGCVVDHDRSMAPRYPTPSAWGYAVGTLLTVILLAVLPAIPGGFDDLFRAFPVVAVLALIFSLPVAYAGDKLGRRVPRQWQQVLLYSIPGLLAGLMIAVVLAVVFAGGPFGSFTGFGFWSEVGLPITGATGSAVMAGRACVWWSVRIPSPHRAPGRPIDQLPEDGQL